MSLEEDSTHHQALEKPLIDANECLFDSKKDVNDDTQLLHFVNDLVLASEKKTDQCILDTIKKEIEENRYELEEHIDDIASHILGEGDL